MPKNLKNKQRSIKFKVFRFIIWFSPGLFLGIFVPWYFYLNAMIDDLFIEFNWSVPASIYAQELNLYEEKSLSKKELLFHLKSLGYNHKDRISRFGDYAINGDDFAIYSKGFNFYDKQEKAKKIYLSIKNERIHSISSTLVRLEPLLIGQLYSSGYQNRIPVKINQIPNTLIKGLQAVEDRGFKHHQGVDLFAILRALVKNIFAGKVVQGGSTITQQLIKNRFNYSKKSWLRKANEAVAAIMLEQKFDKGQIIESYFNEIYWGQHGKIAIHGIKQASLYYFSKIPKQLTLSEQALLIGMIKGPSWYHPIKQRARSKSRRDIVLKIWRNTGVITEKQYKDSLSQTVNVQINSSFASQQYSDFLDIVKKQLPDYFSNKQLKQQGIKIYSTLNPFIQNQLSNTLQDKTNSFGSQIQSSAVVSQAQTGHLLAIKGSKDKTTFYNRAFLSKRQIGSLIKPFVYLASLELDTGFNMQSRVSDSPVKIKTKSGEYWQPSNFDNRSLGKVSADQALYQSRNQAAVNVGMKLGVNKFVQFLQRIGLNINHSHHPSIFLGSTELTPLEVTNLYLMLSSKLQNNQLFAIKYITDKNDQLIGRLKSRSSHLLSESSLEQINFSLNKVTKLGTASKLSSKYLIKEKVYGKTGTTNEGRNSWFVGYNNEILATFWLGYDNNDASSLTGSSGALELWAQWYLSLK